MPIDLGISVALGGLSSGSGVPHTQNNLLLADGASFFLLANGTDVLLLAA